MEKDENSTVVSDDLLGLKQASNFDLPFTQGRQQKFVVYYITQSHFHLPKSKTCNKSNKIILFKRTPRDIILVCHDIAGLDMNLGEWKHPCLKTWENDQHYLQKDRIYKVGEGVYTFGICNKNRYTKCSPETKSF